MPPSPCTTASTILLSGSDRKTMSLAPASSAPLAAARAPAAVMLPATASKPSTSIPASTMRRVMRPPMLPRPMNPMSLMRWVLTVPAAAVHGVVDGTGVPCPGAARGAHGVDDGGAAVGADDLPGDVGGVLAQQERRDPRDLLRRPRPPQRRGRRALRHVVLASGRPGCRREQLGGHDARRDPR